MAGVKGVGRAGSAEKQGSPGNAMVSAVCSLEEFRRRMGVCGEAFSHRMPPLMSPGELSVQEKQVTL